MRVDHRACLRPGSIHPGVHGNDFGAHLGQVTLGYGPVEADHRQIIRPEVVPAADRGDPTLATELAEAADAGS